MNCFKSIINGKEALQQVQINDLAISLDDNQLKQLQMVLFEMYQDILSVCKEAGLTPFLVGGSALGAVRHQGFIPWDDDLDMAMKRNEYNQLINRLQEKFTDKYIVSSPGKGENSCARFTKVFKKNTVFKGLFPARNDQFNGVFVDIFPIENIPDRWCIRILKGIICDIIAYISSQVYNRENNSATSGVALKRTGLFNYHVRMIVGFLFSFHKSSWWFHLFDQFSQSRESASRYSSIPSCSFFVRISVSWP